MGRNCQVTGRGTASGNNVSHSHKKTRRKFKLNLVKKRVFIPGENRWVTLKLSTRALRTLRKKGLKSLMQEHGQDFQKLIDTKPMGHSSAPSQAPAKTEEKAEATTA